MSKKKPLNNSFSNFLDLMETGRANFNGLQELAQHQSKMFENLPQIDLSPLRTVAENLGRITLRPMLNFDEKTLKELGQLSQDAVHHRKLLESLQQLHQRPILNFEKNPLKGLEQSVQKALRGEKMWRNLQQHVGSALQKVDEKVTIQPQPLKIKTEAEKRRPDPSKSVKTRRVGKSWGTDVSLKIINRLSRMNENRIASPPGFVLNRFAEFFCSPKTLELVVGPILSDMQVEYCEALAAGRKLKATWIRVRGYWTFFKALGMYSVMKALSEMWRAVISG